MSRVFFQAFELPSPFKVPSVNSMYKCKSSFGKSFAWLYKDPKVEAYQNEIIRQASSGELCNFAEDIEKIDYIDVTFIFLLDKNYLKRDTSNMIKMTEDALMSITKIDDSKHRKVTASKALSHLPKREFVICSYEVHYHEDK